MSDEPHESIFRPFTLNDAVKHASEFAVFRGEARRTWKGFFACLRTLPTSTQTSITTAALACRGTKRQAATTESPEPIKRRRLDVSTSQATAMQEDTFLKPPSDEDIHSAISRMIDRTSNGALQKGVCMICARLMFLENLELTQARDLKNVHHLKPVQVHPAHKLTNGLLLHTETTAQGETYACLACKAKLAKNLRPPLALANGMWIGEIPFELAVLKLPERLLVALYLPAVYIIKLYPKVPGARAWRKDRIANGLKGNVSSYRLHTTQIADMTSGRMPPPPKILAATIGVTFVGGSRNIPMSVLPDMLLVRRQRVFEALVWLKKNNPLYAKIEISEDNLRLLPANGIPEEILSNIRYSHDKGGLEREQEGYIPLDAADEDDVMAVDSGDNAVEDERSSNRELDCERDMENYEPAVVPIQSHGVLDMHGDSIPDSDLADHAIANLASRVVNQNFNVRRSSDFINEYARRDINGRRFDGGAEDPNHLLGCFPVLFPYGQGGLELEREVDVPYETHIRWLLMYADSRFRTDEYFGFMVYGVLIKRWMCRSAGLQMKRSSFIANSVSFLKLKPADFIKASLEEKKKIPFTNPVVRALRKQLTSIRARVQGTDESRVSIRAQIWSMNLWFNPPNIWVTLSFPDDNDPVAQVLAGADIDLDKFIATAGPNRETRQITIAGNPFAAAEFFHLIVRAIIQEMFGIKVTSHAPPDRRKGILGVVNGYIGTVEAQARGSLHLHILFWMSGSLSSAAMNKALQSEAFRAQVLSFLRKTVKADIPGTTGPDVLELKKEKSVAYSRPEDPRQPNYEARRTHMEAKVARAVQVHECKPTTCMRIKNGRLVCKRRAPWPEAPDHWLHPSGEWGPRRPFGLVNAWNPALLQVTRSNQDIKLITNGQFTKDITFYISMYIAKKQNQGSNPSALLATSPAFQRKPQVDVRDLNRRMIQQCANTLSREQELSGSEVVSYLMGWGDRFLSHQFVPIYWDEVAGALRRTFPSLQCNGFMRRLAEELGETAPANAHETPYDAPVRLTLEKNEFTVKDQLKEYMDRGEELESMNFLDYHVNTYDGKSGTARQGKPSEIEDDQERRIGRETTHSRAGRPPNRRVPYRQEANRKGCRVFRSEGSETLPQFIGKWFPSKDDVEYYCANILALLKPWRKLVDLPAPDDSFTLAFDAFMAEASPAQKRIVENIDYFYECSAAAKKTQGPPLEMLSGTADLNDHSVRDPGADSNEYIEAQITEADIEIARNERYPFREFLYGEGAMSVASALGIFEVDTTSPVPIKPSLQATWEQTIQFAEWGEKLKDLSKANALLPSNLVTLFENNAAVLEADPIPVPEAVQVASEQRTGLKIRSPKQQATLNMLNEEQRRAHDIIEDHLRKTIEGKNPEQLLMIVRGEGGTGKTVLLNAIADTFEFHDVSKWLAKTATTGVAASLVGGVTVHNWAAIPLISKDTPDWFKQTSVDSIAKRKKNILPARYVNVDECSMMTKKVLAQLSQIIGAVRGSEGLGDSTIPFGGMNMILVGDFHQFPPVGDATNALYCPVNARTQNQIGAALYRQFTTVVTLTQQIRIVDERWRQFLCRLRTGSCTGDDLDILNTLLVSHPSCQLPSPQGQGWSSAVLVTPRHSARIRWNTASIMKHCATTGNQLYISQAEDTLGRKEEQLDLLQRIIVAGMPIKKTAKLAERVELAVGMRAMVLINIATEADLANGTRGEVIKIMLDPREPSEPEYQEETGGIILHYPPVLVLFKPDDSNCPSFEGLPSGVLPIVPVRFGFGIQANGKNSTVYRRQLAMTPAYAFTDYKSQGQTIHHVFIDLEKPPSGKLTPFSAYVALSRSRGRDNIRLLRGFDPELFTTHPSLDLETEDARLDALTLETKRIFCEQRACPVRTDS